MQLGLKSIRIVLRVTEEKLLRKYNLYKNLNVAKRRVVRSSECWVLQQHSHSGDLVFLSGIPLLVQSPTSKAKLGKLGE